MVLCKAYYDRQTGELHGRQMAPGMSCPNCRFEGRDCEADDYRILAIDDYLYQSWRLDDPKVAAWKSEHVSELEILFAQALHLLERVTPQDLESDRVATLVFLCQNLEADCGFDLYDTIYFRYVRWILSMNDEDLLDMNTKRRLARWPSLYEAYLQTLVPDDHGPFRAEHARIVLQEKSNSMLRSVVRPDLPSSMLEDSDCQLDD